jgi:hypothetical protein
LQIQHAVDGSANDDQRDGADEQNQEEDQGATPPGVVALPGRTVLP